MSDTFFELMFVVAIGLLLITPPVLILYGVYKKAESKGFLCFMIGASCYAVLITILLTPYVCRILSQLLCILGIDATFRKTEIVGIPLGILSIYGCYKLFGVIYHWECRKFIPDAKLFILQMQDSKYPPCEELIIGEITRYFLHNPSARKNPLDPIRYSKFLVYDAAARLLSSTQFHSPTTGSLLPMGESLYFLCSNCLEYFRKASCISERAYKRKLSTLCGLTYHDFSSNPQPVYEPQETVYLMEARNGMLVRVPESKLKAWEEAQSQAEVCPLSAAERQLVNRITDDIYSSKNSHPK